MLVGTAYSQREKGGEVEMIEEAIKTLCELLQNAGVMLQELVENLSRFACSSNEEQLSIPFQKPYHCRACGRRYATPKEVRLCMRLHQKGRADIKASARFHGKHAGLRVAPRNREAAMRSTEIRRYKQTASNSERR